MVVRTASGGLINSERRKHPASEREDEELQRRRHSLRLLGRLDQHRPSLGRFFAPYAIEIIWGNRSLHAGDYKVIGSFPHYVANGGRENIGRWHQEAVDLTEIYETLWGDPVGARMIDIAIFCDSDETGDETLAYVADVRVQRR